MSATATSPLTFVLSKTPLDYSIQKHLRNVYSTLLSAVILATAGAFIDLSTRLPLGYIAMFLTLPTLIYFSWFTAPFSKTRAATFYLFALLDGLAAGPLVEIAVDADPRIPLIAFVAAAVVFAGFTVSALFAKRGSYLALGAFLWTALWGLLLLSFINVFASKLIGVGPLLYGGLLLMCGFVLYDTQAIVEKASRGDRDHIRHAMDLLIDFVGMVKRLIIIMVRNNQRRERESEKKGRRN